MASRYLPNRGAWSGFLPSPRPVMSRLEDVPPCCLAGASYNAKVGLAIFCPITSQVKGYPFEVAVPSGCKVGGVILSDQVKNLDWRVRKARLICRVPQETTLEVLAKLETLLSSET